MATFNTTKTAAGVQPRSEHMGVVSVSAKYTILAVLATGDIIEMVKIPKGAVILDLVLTAEDLSTGADIILNVGDGGDIDRFIDSSTIAQAGGVARLGAGVAAAALDGAAYFTYAADDTIDVQVEAGGTATATGDITLSVLYSMQA